MALNLKNIGMLLLGVAVGFAIQVYAAQPTDVRVGNTATIGVSTNCEGNIVYIANGNGIFKSSNGGETWDEIY